MDPVAKICRVLQQLAPELPMEEVEEFARKGRPLPIADRGFFCAPGTRDHRLGFLHEGILRYHVLTPDGDDVTKDFSLPNSFAMSFGSAVRGLPAEVAISAVGACTLTVWPYSALEEQYGRSAAWERLGRHVAEMLYVRKERRELSFLLRSAQERYAEARETFGEALGQIPQHQLASYLGIAPETLSRLRRSAVRSLGRRRARGLEHNP